MNFELGIRRPLRRTTEDRLNIVEWLIPGARHISHDALPGSVSKQAVEPRKFPPDLRGDGDTTRDRISLLMSAGFQLSIDDLLPEPLKVLWGKKIADLDEAVAFELAAQIRREQVRKPRSAPICKGVGCLEPPNVETCPV